LPSYKATEEAISHCVHPTRTERHLSEPVR
jgi:hypothetical protein